MGTITANIDGQGKNFIDNGDGTHLFEISSSSIGDADIDVVANGQALSTYSLSFVSAQQQQSQIDFTLSVSAVDEGVDQTISPQLEMTTSAGLPSGLIFQVAPREAVDSNNNPISTSARNGSDFDQNPITIYPSQNATSFNLPFDLIDDQIFEGHSGGTQEDAEICLFIILQIAVQIRL